MCVIHLHVSKEEQNALNQASKIYGCDVSTMMIKIVFDTLENQLDLNVIEQYEYKKKNGTLKTYPIDTLWKQLEIDE